MCQRDFKTGIRSQPILALSVYSCMSYKPRLLQARCQKFCTFDKLTQVVRSFLREVKFFFPVKILGWNKKHITEASFHPLKIIQTSLWLQEIKQVVLSIILKQSDKERIEVKNSQQTKRKKKVQYNGQ